MGLTTQNLKSWSVERYMIAVLWMEGRLSTSEIARQVDWTLGQVKGFYHKEFVPVRDKMTDEERQEVLDHLKEWRGWFKVFVDKRFDDRFFAKGLRYQSLAKRREEAEAREGINVANLSKRERKRLADEEAHKRRQEAKERAEREMGYAPRGRDVDAVDWLYLHSLNDKKEDVVVGALMSRDRRKEALLKFRVHMEGSAVSPLRAQDYEAARGQGARIALPEFRKHCIDMLGGARSVLHPAIFKMLERIVMHDEFVWSRIGSGSERGKVYEAIRYGADTLASYYQIMTPKEFEARWGVYPPEAPLPSRQAAREASHNAQQIIDELTKRAA